MRLKNTRPKMAFVWKKVDTLQKILKQISQFRLINFKQSIFEPNNQFQKADPCFKS